MTLEQLKKAKKIEADIKLKQIDIDRLKCESSYLIEKYDLDRIQLSSTITSPLPFNVHRLKDYINNEIENLAMEKQELIDELAAL